MMVVRMKLNYLSKVKVVFSLSTLYMEEPVFSHSVFVTFKKLKHICFGYEVDKDVLIDDVSKKYRDEFNRRAKEVLKLYRTNKYFSDDNKVMLGGKYIFSCSWKLQNPQWVFLTKEQVRRYRKYKKGQIVNKGWLRK